MTESAADRPTQLLFRLSQGESGVADELMPLIYEELKTLAREQMARERDNHTLQPTALVHEAYLRLIHSNDASWDSRGHFYSMATKVMRSLLVDHARRARAQKRGGQHDRIALDASAEPWAASPVETLALHDALTGLAELDEELGRIVELRFFGGLGMDAIARILDRPKRTIERRWKAASTWLSRELSHE